MEGSYNYWMVILSVVVAIFASYTALNLATRHPQWFANAASVSGYDKAAIDGETEDIFKGRQDINDANTVSLNSGCEGHADLVRQIEGRFIDSTGVAAWLVPPR